MRNVITTDTVQFLDATGAVGVTLALSGGVLCSNGSPIDAGAILFGHSGKGSADATAATATAEHMVFVATQACTITKASFLPDSTLTANDTNFATLKVWTRAAGGGSQVAVALKTTAITGGSGNWTAFSQINLGTITNASLAAGASITIEITKTGTGVIVPSGAWQIEFTIP